MLLCRFPSRENGLVRLGVCGNRCLQRYWQRNRSPALWGRSHHLHHGPTREDSETDRRRGTDLLGPIRTAAVCSPVDSKGVKVVSFRGNRNNPCCEYRSRWGVESVCRLSATRQRRRTSRSCLSRSNMSRKAGWTCWWTTLMLAFRYGAVRDRYLPCHILKITQKPSGWNVVSGYLWQHGQKVLGNWAVHMGLNQQRWPQVRVAVTKPLNEGFTHRLPCFSCL